MKIKANEKLFNEAKSSCSSLKLYCTSFADFFSGIMQNDMTLSDKELDEYNQEFEKAKKRLKMKMKETFDNIDEIKKRIDEHIERTNK
jgi:hypothetical protein